MVIQNIFFVFSLITLQFSSVIPRFLAVVILAYNLTFTIIALLLKGLKINCSWGH